MGFAQRLGKPGPERLPAAAGRNALASASIARHTTGVPIHADMAFQRGPDGS